MSLGVTNEFLLFSKQQEIVDVKKEIIRLEDKIDFDNLRLNTPTFKPGAPRRQVLQTAIRDNQTKIKNFISNVIPDIERQIEQIRENIIETANLTFSIEQDPIATPVEIKPPGEDIPISSIVEQISIQPIIESIPEEIKQINPLFLAGGAIIAILILR